MNLHEIVRRHARRPVRVSVPSQQLRRCRQFANHIVRVLFSALIACGYHLRWTNLVLVRWIDNTYDQALAAARSNVLRTAYLKSIKASCFEARSIALRRTTSLGSRSHIRNVTGVLVPRGYHLTPDALYQLSCVSRALPLGGDIEVEEALEQFRETCLSPESVPIITPLQFSGQLYLLERKQNVNLLKRLARLWKRKEKSVRISPTGESACAAFNSREGGRTRHFAMVTEAHPRTERFVATATGSLAYGSPEQDVHERRIDTYMRHCASRPRMASRTSVVRELGNKVRVVTINDPYLVANAHRVRKVLFPAVTNRRGCREALGELPLELPLHRDTSKRAVVISGDLSRATDTLSHSWLSRLCHTLGIPPSLIFENMRVGDATVVRGAFMGLPASWTLLELTHILICRCVDPLGNYFLKGDDIIAVWVKKQWKLYQRLCSAVGFEINISKSFIARTRGTFCEGLYSLSQNARGPCLRLNPTFPLRGFVTRRPGAFYPDLATTMNSCVNRGCQRSVIWNLVSNSFSKEIELAHKFKVNLYLPECLGGLGLPHPDPSSLSGHYISSLVWGGLNSDLPSPPHFARGANGPLSKKISKHLRQIKWRSGVQPVDSCPHIEHRIAFLLMRISVYERHSERSCIGKHKYLGALASMRKKIPLAPIRPRDLLKWQSIPALFKELKPTMTSVQKVYLHKCDGTREESTL